MKSWPIVLVLLLVVTSSPARPASAQQAVPALSFDSVPDFLKLPAGMNFGEVSGVAVNSKGHVFVFTRSNSAHGPAYAPTAAQLLEFGAKGEFIREIGKDLYALVVRAHGAHRQGRQHLGRRQGLGHDRQVQPGRTRDAGVRTPEGIGRRGHAGRGSTPIRRCPHVDGLFRQPTDVAWDSDGNIYISDGYVNSRVAKYDQNGDWVKSWGERGTGAGAVQPAARHRRSIANNNIYVGDRIEPAHPGVRHRRASSCGCSRSTCRRRRARAPSTATRRPASAWRR